MAGDDPAAGDDSAPETTWRSWPERTRRSATTCRSATTWRAETTGPT